MTINLTKAVPTSDPVRDLLLKAAQVMEARGWFRGWYEGPNECVCMYGALRAAATGDAMREPSWLDSGMEVFRNAELRMSRAVNGGELDPHSDTYVGIAQWSDACGGTDAAVAKLREAAELAL